MTWMRGREREKTALNCSVILSSPSQSSSQPVLWRSVEQRESRRAENSPGWLGWGIACWEVSRRSGITGQTERGKETGRGVWARERPCRGHGWMGTLSKISSSLCRLQLLDTNGIDSWQGEQPLPGPTHHHSLLPQWHPSLSLYPECLPLGFRLWCMSNATPLNHSNFNCSMYLQEVTLFHTTNAWQSTQICTAMINYIAFYC